MLVSCILYVCVCVTAQLESENEMRFQTSSSAQKLMIVFDDQCVSVCEQVHLTCLSICLRSLRKKEK